MVKLDRIYTRGGDAGETSLADGARVAKSSARVAAYGDVDEANAAIGVARLDADEAISGILAAIQNDLFDLGADLALPLEDAPPRERLRVTQPQVDRLERDIDRFNESLQPLTSFILPGGSATAARLHVARTIVRRAERKVVSLLELPAERVNRLALIYLNRLSDLLFVLARAANENGAADVLWTPGANR